MMLSICALMWDKGKVIFHLLIVVFLWSLRAILSWQPTMWYSHWISSSGHIFMCSSTSSLPTSQQAMGNLGHCSLCSSSINWCSPVMWQYWQSTLWRKHSSWTWPARYCLCKHFPQSLEHVTSSNWQPSLFPRWLMMSFTSPCHSHPLSLLVQNTWRLLIARSTCLLWRVINSSLRQMGQAWEMLVALFAASRQDLQNVRPQHPLRWGSLLGYWQILHTNISSGASPYINSGIYKIETV